MGSHCIRRFLSATRTVPLHKVERSSSSQLALQQCNLSSHAESQITATPNLGIRNSPVQDVSMMPGPRVLPGLGTEWVYSPFGPYSVDQIHTAKPEMREDYGSIYKEKLGGHWVVNVHNVDDIQIMFRNEGPRPIRSVQQGHVYYRKHTNHCPQYNKNPGMVDAAGDEWYNLRKTINPVLMKTDTMKTWTSAASDVADIWISYIKQSRTMGNIIHDIQMEIRRYGFNYFKCIIFGHKIGSLDKAEEFINLSTQLNLTNNTFATKTKWHLWKYFPTPAWRKLVATNIGIDRYVEQGIQKYKKDQASMIFDESIIAKLRKQAVNEADIQSLIFDLLASSSETMAAFMTRVFHRLGQEPRIQRNLQRELDAAMGDPAQILTWKALNNMPYLKATIKESYRLLTIIPGLLRISPKKLELQGYEIPAYTPVVAQTYTECLREENFIRALEFIPERWLNTKDISKEQIEIYEKQVGDLGVLHQETRVSRYLVLPFSFGSRSCLGRRMAEAEIHVILAKVLLNFNIESHGELGLECIPFMAPSHPIKMVFRDR